MVKALFLPCYYDGLPRSSGSARIRCQWVAQNWPEADVYDGSQRFTDYCAFVFQKLYLTESPRQWIQDLARMRDRGGQKIVLAFDLCDPDFLQYEHEHRMLEMLPLFDFAVATTEPIADYLHRWLPTWVIPDRVDVAEVEKIGKHTFTDTDRPRLVWAGYERNAKALSSMLPVIQGLGLDLDVLAFDKPVPFEEFWRRVIEYDVLLNPRPDVPPFNYKSDNKALVAHALGVAVARTEYDIAPLCEPLDRARHIDKGRAELLDRWEIGRSVANWQKLLKAWGV
jgi:hypothetical protein